MIEEPASPDRLKNQRQILRGRRRAKLWQALARFVVVGGLAGGLIWTFTLPYWLLRSPRQVSVNGNKLIAADSLRSSLKLSYPLSIWTLPADRARSNLEKNPAIDTVSIDRRLLPPSVIINIVERVPVARLRGGSQKAFLDADGAIIPERYYDGDKNRKLLPSLVVYGYTELDRSRWRKFYPLINNLPVKIAAIDWRDASNLVLNSELGTIHLGAIDEKLPEKLTALAGARQLSSKIPRERLQYIDLSDPAAPTVQLKPPPKPPLTTAANSDPNRR